LAGAEKKPETCRLVPVEIFSRPEVTGPILDTSGGTEPAAVYRPPGRWLKTRFPPGWSKLSRC